MLLVLLDLRNIEAMIHWRKLKKRNTGSKLLETHWLDTLSYFCLSVPTYGHIG